MGQAGGHEGLRAAGVVDIARPVQDIEDLARLRHGAEQRVVAARPFLGLAVADGAALGMPLRVDDRAIEVQREPGELEAVQPVLHELAAEGADLGHAAGIGLPERATDRGDVRQPREAQEPPEEGIVPVVAGIAELAIAQEQVHDEQEDDEVVAEDRRDVQMAEAGAQAVLELQAAQEGLQEDEPAVGGQGLLLEAEGGEFVDFAMDRGSAMFHRAVASVGDWWDATSHSHRSQSGGHCLLNSVAVGRRQPWIPLPVRSSTRRRDLSSTGDFRGDSCLITASFMRPEGSSAPRPALTPSTH